MTYSELQIEDWTHSLIANATAEACQKFRDRYGPQVPADNVEKLGEWSVLLRIYHPHDGVNGGEKGGLRVLAVPGWGEDAGAAGQIFPVVPSPAAPTSARGVLRPTASTPIHTRAAPSRDSRTAGGTALEKVFTISFITLSSFTQTWINHAKNDCDKINM